VNLKSTRTRIATAKEYESFQLNFSGLRKDSRMGGIRFTNPLLRCLANAK